MAVRVGGGVAMLVVMGAVRVHAEAILVVLVVVLAIIVFALVLIERVGHALEREGVDAEDLVQGHARVARLDLLGERAWVRVGVGLGVGAGVGVGLALGLGLGLG